MNSFNVVATSARLYLVSLADKLFGCRHRKTTMPMTMPRDATTRGEMSAQNATYIVCLQCGRRIAYDMRKMGVVK